ncbi:MAG: Ig-like domain-containing protein [Bacteroidales bacterium]
MALLGALIPVPLSAQTNIASSLTKDYVIGVDAAGDPLADGTTLTITGTAVRTNGHSITVKNGGTLTIAAGATLTISNSTVDVITLEPGSDAVNNGTIIAAAYSGSGLGSHGITFANGGDGAANVTNNGLIDFGAGGVIKVEHAATISSPGLIIFRKDPTHETANDGTLRIEVEEAPTLTGFTLTLQNGNGSSKNALEVHGENQNWSALLQEQFVKNAKTKLLVGGPKQTNKLTIPQGVALNVPEGYLLDVAGGEVTISGALNNSGLVTISSGTVLVDNTGTVTNGTETHRNALINVNDSWTNDSKKAITTNGGAKVKNWGIINLGAASSLENNSSFVESPGIVLINNGNALSGTKALAQGFAKTNANGGTGTPFIQVYGAAEWTDWHSELLNPPTTYALLPTKISGGLTGEVGLSYGDAAQLRIEQGGVNHGDDSNPLTDVTPLNKLIVPDGITLTIKNNNSSGEDLWVSDSLVVEKGGKLIVTNSASALIDESDARGALRIANGGLARLEGGATATIEKNEASGSETTHIPAYIETGGKLEVTGGSTLTNNSAKTISDGIIELSGGGSLSGGTATPYVFPQRAMVVDLQSTASASFINVIGENYWSDALQEYLTDGAVTKIKLNRSSDVLNLTRKYLTVPNTLTLTITAANENENAGVGKIISNSSAAFKSEGITILAGGFNLDYIENPSGKKTLKDGVLLHSGFFQTNSLLTVYGTGNKWENIHQQALNAGVSVVFIPEKYELTFDAMDILKGRTVINSGTLTGTAGGSLQVRGELRKNATSTNNLNGTVNITGDGIVKAEIRESWITFPKQGEVSSDDLNSLFVVTDPDNSAYILGTTSTVPYTLKAGEDFYVINPYQNGEAYRNIVGSNNDLNAEDYNPDSHYYGELPTDYHAVTGIEIDGKPASPKDTFHLAYLKDTTLTATVSPALPKNDDGKEVVNTHSLWESTNTTIAVVEDPLVGKVTAISTGTAKIYAISVENGKKDSCYVKVFTAVSEVVIDTTAETITLPLAGPEATVQLEAHVLPSVAENQVIRWESADEDVATATDGLITAVGLGETEVYAIADADPTKQDTIYIKVVDVPVEKIAIADKEANDSVAVNDKLQLSFVPVPAYATADLEVKWTSADTLIAKVDSTTGELTGIKEGKTRIYATTKVGGIKDSLDVTVYPVKIKSITLTISSDNQVIEVGTAGKEIIRLTAEIDPANATNQTLHWTSNNEAIATVEGEGLTGTVSGTGKGEGEATIRVYSDENHSISISQIITVSINPNNRVTGVMLDPKEATLAKGDSTQLTATVLAPAVAANSDVKWESDDEGVATVDSAGKVRGVGAGTAKIIVTTADNNKKDTATIKVYVPLDSIRILTGGEEIAVGESREIGYTAYDADATIDSVVYTISPDSVARVEKDSAGKVTVTGESDGTATLTLTVYVPDGVQEYETTLTVYTIKPQITGVTIESAGDELLVGETLQLSAHIEYVGDASPAYSLTWSITTGEGNATIDEDGLVTGKAIGEAEVHILVTSADGSTVAASKTIKVVEEKPEPVIPEISEVAIAGGKETLAIDSTLQLSAVVTVEPVDSTIAYETAWESSDEEVATVDETGLVTAVAEGEATIYLSVITADSAYTAELTLTVTEEPVTPVEPVVPEITEVAIAGATDSLAVEATLLLEAVVTVEGEGEVDYEVEWASSDEEVATVNETGLVTGVADGEAVITLTVTTEDSVFKADVTIEVYTEPEDTTPVVPEPVIPEITAVAIAGATDSLEVEATLQLSADVTIEPADSTIAYETAWATSDEAVATVSEDGLVTAVSEGSATITLTVTTEDGEFTAEVTIAVYTEEVVPQPIPVEGVTIDQEATTLAIDETLQLTYAIEPADADVEYSVAWSSDNEAVATVEDGVVTAIAEGTAIITITVTTEDGEFTASVTITVEEGDGVEVPVTSVKVYIADNTLYVNSAVTEKIDIYTISGKLVYSAVKPAGEVQITLNSLSDGVLIIRGASGWVQKIVK